MSADTVHTSGIIDDLLDVVVPDRDTIDRGKERLRQEIDRMRDAYARARMRRALNLALFLGLAYLLLRKKR